MSAAIGPRLVSLLGLLCMIALAWACHSETPYPWANSIAGILLYE